MEHTTAALKAARRILEEVHFGADKSAGCAGATHPENAKFLDRRAAELAPIIDQETHVSDLLAACDRAALADELAAALNYVIACPGNRNAVTQGEAALAKYEAQKGGSQ